MAYAFSSRRLSNSVIAMVTLIWDLCIGGLIPPFPKLVMYIGQSRQLLYKFSPYKGRHRATFLATASLRFNSRPRFSPASAASSISPSSMYDIAKIFFLARVMHLHSKIFKERINPMTPKWTGYLVRALNEFASLTAACGTIDASGGIPIRAKASIDADSEHQSKQKKSSEKPRRRKYNRKG